MFQDLIQSLRFVGAQNLSTIGLSTDRDGPFIQDYIYENGNKKQYFRVSQSPITWDGRKSVLVTMQDITAQKLSEEKELINDLKQAIFNTFTHELLTPLNGLVCAESLL